MEVKFLVSGRGAGVFLASGRGAGFFFDAEKYKPPPPLPVNSEPSVIRPGGEGTLNL